MVLVAGGMKRNPKTRGIKEPCSLSVRQCVGKVKLLADRIIRQARDSGVHLTCDR